MTTEEFDKKRAEYSIKRTNHKEKILTIFHHAQVSQIYIVCKCNYSLALRLVQLCTRIPFYFPAVALFPFVRLISEFI